MSDDLLRHLVGPTPYSSATLWLAAALTAILVGFYVGVVLLTWTRGRFGEVPLLGKARDLVVRQRHARTVREIVTRYRAGQLDAAQAGAAISREVRRFLHRTTGRPAEYMHLDDIAHDDVIGSAATVLEPLTDVQFNAASSFDVGVVGEDAEELIRSWT